MERRVFLAIASAGLLAAPLGAEALGLTIPSSLLRRADEVIQ